MAQIETIRAVETRNPNVAPRPRAGAAHPSLLRHFAYSLAIATGLTLPLPLAGSSAHPVPLAAATLLFFLLNLNLTESALTELAGRRPGRPLPARRFRAGISASQRTVVVYPVLFRSDSELRTFVRDSLVRSLIANPDPNLVWAVISGSPEPIATRERQAIRTILNRSPDRSLLYLHRHPGVANWERKRGAYMHLSRWIVEGCRADGRISRSPHFPAMPCGSVFDQIVGDPAAARGAENMLIGDSDTRWPPGSVEGLIARIAHPANSAYVIFQGRIAAHNEGASVLSYLQRLLDDLFRSQQAAIGRVYGRMLFTGHGAGWNIRRFLDGIAGRMRDGYLSHDIVEAYFLPTVAVPEVETTEEAQETIPNLIRQWQRWWRGNRIATLRLLGFWRRDESGVRVRNRNPIGKLLLLHADRNFLMPSVLAGYLLLMSILTVRGELGARFFVYGTFYLGAIMLRFYLPLLARVGDRVSLRKIVFTIIFLTLLAHVLLVEKVRVVLRDLRAAIAESCPAHAGGQEWVVQGSLPTERTIRSALRLTWAYPLITAAVLAGILQSPGFITPLTVVPLAILASAPLLVWYAAQPPPRWLLDGRPATPDQSSRREERSGRPSSRRWSSRTASCGA